MWTDVVDLRDFYQTPLGGVTRRILRHRIRTIWPDCKGMNILGLGYAVPYLGLFKNEAVRTLAFMPSQQGVLHWPQEGKSQTCLVDELELPLADVSMDRVIMVHDLEHAGHLRRLLREVWRVLDGSGRVLIIVPNRTGIWARTERTPFGTGHPFSPGQINRLLRDNMFTPLSASHGLFIPPTRFKMILGAASAMETIGLKVFPGLGGVCLVEATKQIYAANPLATKQVKKGAMIGIPTR